MIQTIINEPLILTSNSSPITFNTTNIRTRCAYCCNGGWLDYENGNPLFRVFGNGYNGYYNATFTGTISSATAGVVAIGLYEDGVLLPDTVRAVTLAAADDVAVVSIDRDLRLCPRGTSSVTIDAVPTIPTPTDPTTPITTEIPIIVSGTFKLKRKNGV